MSSLVALFAEHYQIIGAVEHILHPVASVQRLDMVHVQTPASFNAAFLTTKFGATHCQPGSSRPIKVIFVFPATFRGTKTTDSFIRELIAAPPASTITLIAGQDFVGAISILKHYCFFFSNIATYGPDSPPSISLIRQPVPSTSFFISSIVRNKKPSHDDLYRL